MRLKARIPVIITLINKLISSFICTMQFEHNKSMESLGEKAGYIFAYFLFSTALYSLLYILHKLGSWTYFHIMGLALAVALFAILVRGLLK